MKKRYFVLGAFLAMTSLFTLASCDDNTNANGTNASAVIVENEEASKVYNEYKKSLPDIDYNDFLTNGKRYTTYSNDLIIYEYNSSQIYLKNDGSFVRKDICEIEDDGSETTILIAKYVNNDWVVTSDLYYNDNGEKVHRNFVYNEDYSLDSKTEYTYKDNICTSRAEFHYVNNDWLKTSEDVYIDGKFYTMFFSVCGENLNDWSKWEIIYDENMNDVGEIYSSYINNQWVTKRKFEYEYSEDGHRTSRKYSEYVDGVWVDIDKYEYINEIQFDGFRKIEYQNNRVYSISLYENTGNKASINPLKHYTIFVGSDGEYKTKVEYTYDFYGIEVSNKTYTYENGQWVDDSLK
ncbi:MAG: hypothetical protein IJP63_05375 [Acholeplasmatales bacterium]|nr:hypothetical protein [Acholeplasmatales bacterium]